MNIPSGGARNIKFLSGKKSLRKTSFERYILFMSSLRVSLGAGKKIPPHRTFNSMKIFSSS